ncbi:hypothetical protein GGI12_001065 [Dipsacomyces acuminosporus]|nr:hypothetical protein GGI12_001065 [Dipsacomyces acuminosporus]
MGNLCFNCSMPGHELRDCPMPLDRDTIEANRQVFKDKGSGQFSGRFYLAVEDEKHADRMCKKFKPGQELSEELMLALGLVHGENEIPEYIESMYYNGYPPAYLGMEEGQDPMTARGPQLDLAPPTPDLKVYDNAEEYDSNTGAGDSTNVIDGDSNIAMANSHQNAEELDGNTDEEGAISETEEPAPKPVRSVPLVKYPGLDLAAFDFNSLDRPGKPLQLRTPRRRAYDGANGSYNSHHNDYGSDYYSDRYRSRDDRYYYDNGSARGYPRSAPSTHRSRYANGDGWTGMLDGYYRSESAVEQQPTQSQSQTLVGGTQAPNQKTMPSTDKDEQTGAAQQLPTTTATANNNGDDSELEDGECDMSESDSE